MPPRPATLTLVLGLAACCVPGCSVYKFYRITAMVEPSVYNRKADRIASLTKYRKTAEQVWESTGLACPEDHSDEDYRDGFVVGFADYVYAGGDGSPPPVPPRRYWCVEERTPEGASRIQSWFAGYRHGAGVARLGGYRKVATIGVSASVRDCTPCGCPNESATPTRQHAASPPVINVAPSPLRQGPSDETLPLPPPAEGTLDGALDDEDPFIDDPSDAVSAPPSELNLPELFGDLPATKGMTGGPTRHIERDASTATPRARHASHSSSTRQAVFEPEANRPRSVSQPAPAAGDARAEVMAPRPPTRDSFQPHPLAPMFSR